jgi:prepilin-type N-terminal cleavage/methylation domain-containing protein
MSGEMNMQRIREIKKNQSGFTLIELLIVIVILGVLAAVVVFAVGAFNNKGKAAACQSDFKNLEIADEAYYANVTPPATPAYAPDAATLVTKGYLKEAPSTTSGYVFTYSTTTGISVAVNGGTAGPISNCSNLN